MNNYTNSLFIIALLISVFYAKNSLASSASVHSVYGQPQILQNNIKIQTITRGIAANSPVYKPMIQTVSKTLLKQVFKKAVKSTPYGFAFLTAYDYFSEDDIIKQQITETTFKCEVFKSTYNQKFEFFGLTPESCKSIADDYNPSNNTSWWFFQGPNYATLRLGAGYIAVLTLPEQTTQSNPVNDDDLLQSLIEYINNNPNIDHSELFINEDGSVNQDYFPSPNFKLNTQSEQDLMDQYASGLLQTDDPNLDYYVTPQEYLNIQNIYNQQNPTIEEQADLLTNAEKQPITQSQHEQNIKDAESREQKDADSLKTISLDPLDKTNQLDEQSNILDNMFNQTTDLPSLLPSLPQFLHSSSCQTVDILGISFPSSSQCSKLNVMKKMIGYFLYVVFFWMIITQLLKEAN